MDWENPGIDPEIFAEFLDESCEGLDAVSDLIVKLERGPEDIEIVQSIFRHIHSIKGNAAFFGLLHTKTLAHRLENVLDLIRKEALVADGNVVSVLLEGTDQMTGIFKRVRRGEAEIEEADVLLSVISKLEKMSVVKKKDETTLWKRLFSLLPESGSDELLRVAAELSRFSSAGMAVHRERGKTGSSIPEPLIDLENIFLNLTSDPSETEVTALFKACVPLFQDNMVSLISEAIGTVEVSARTIGLGDSLSRESILEYVSRLKSGFEGTAPETGNRAERDDTPGEIRNDAHPHILDSTRTKASKKAGATETKPSKTIRIPEESIDGFLSYVGELVTIGEMYSNFQDKMNSSIDIVSAGADLRRINDLFHSLSESLQKSIIDIRLLPLNTVMQKIPRMVRDIAKTQGKEIDVILEGETIKVDKSIIDSLDAPITHIIRNAADHGIESQEERIKAGKEPAGKIKVSGAISGEEVVIKICDDGKGLNLKALEEKAKKMCLIAGDSKIPDEDIIDLLFHPGVTTAEEVTDISGRGVGMDVVRKEVDRKGGKISVQTVQGSGTEFTLSIPVSVTTVIIRGFVVAVDGTRFIFPLEKVENAFSVRSSDFITVPGGGKCIKLGNAIIPVISLADFFGLNPSTEGNPITLLLINSSDIRLAVAVDEMLGIKKCVLKRMEGIEYGGNYFKGAAVMGDSSVAIVLDVEMLLQER